MPVQYPLHLNDLLGQARQALLPACADETAARDGVGVVGQRERDDVGVKTVENKTLTTVEEAK